MMKKSVKRMAAGFMAAGMILSTGVPAYAGLFGGKKAAAETTAAAAEKTEYTFTYKDQEIKLDAEAAPILKELGKYDSVFEEQSCAYQGLDRVYMYPGVEIATYPVKNKEHVSALYITDNTVATPEGIKIGSTYDQMVKAYGKDYTEEFGVYRYVLGTSQVAFYTTKNVVDSIEYLIKK